MMHLFDSHGTTPNFAIIAAMGFIDYDPNVHGLIHMPDWKFRYTCGEAAISAVEHVPTKILFFPTCRVADNLEPYFATTYEGSLPDSFDIALLAQQAMRFYCIHLKTTPEDEQIKYKRRA
ncbi:MAG: hypothetical protein ACLQVY_21840 [Limisphaerales bacterium]